MRYPGLVTRLPWLAMALVTLPVACTILADNALPNDTAAGGAGSGTGSGTGMGTGTAGAGTGTATGAGEICFNGLDDNDDGDVDCGDPACGGTCTLVEPGATVVVPASSDTCPNGFEPRTMASCEGCSCDQAGAGTCVFEYELYTTKDCMGTPAATGLSGGVDCVDLTTPVVADGGDKVGAKGNIVGAGDACTPTTASAPASLRVLCEPSAEAAGCARDLVCVPPSSGMACRLFDGDVACPQDFSARELIFDASSGTCDCACETVDQICPTTPENEVHYHAKADPGCGGGKYDVNVVMGCQDTNLDQVSSVEQHNKPQPATSAACANASSLSSASVLTLCCPG